MPDKVKKIINYKFNIIILKFKFIIYNLEL